MMFSKPKNKNKKFIACTGKKKYEFMNPKDLILKDGKEKEPVE